jgi:hypothetical protein
VKGKAMAWYTINYKCGHTDRKQLYGKESGRKSYIEWAEENADCPECYEKIKEAKRKAAVEAEKGVCGEIRKTLEQSGITLPELQGSEKQVSWAKDILSKLLDSNIGWAIKGLIERNPETASKAKYWIDRRSRPEIDWVRLAISTQWNSQWTKECPEVVWAARILGNRIHGKSNAEIIDKLNTLKGLPIPIKPEIKTMQYGGNGSMGLTSECAQQYDEWLSSNWVHSGLIEWLAGFMDDIAAQQAKEASQNLDDAIQTQKAAEAAKREALAAQAEADQIAAEAADATQAAVEHIAVVMGAKGVYSSSVFEVVGIIDQGGRVIVRSEYGNEIELSRSIWIKCNMTYRMEYCQ